MAPASKFAEALKTDLTKQQAQTAASRSFTGDSNREIARGMEPDASSSRSTTAAGSPVSKLTAMPAFTAGAASLSESPSKKRSSSRQFKLPQAAKSSNIASAPKINPFAAHGLTDPASKATGLSNGSPSKPQQAQTSPATRHRRAVRQNSRPQGMHIDPPVQAAKPVMQAPDVSMAQPDSAVRSSAAGATGNAAFPPQAATTNLSHNNSSFYSRRQASKAQPHAGMVSVPAACLW